MLYQFRLHRFNGIPSTAIVIARPQESQLKLEVEFHRVPYNQTFDFVTGQFVKILMPACL